MDMFEIFTLVRELMATHADAVNFTVVVSGLTVIAVLASQWLMRWAGRDKTASFSDLARQILDRLRARKDIKYSWWPRVSRALYHDSSIGVDTDSKTVWVLINDNARDVTSSLDRAEKKAIFRLASKIGQEMLVENKRANLREALAALSKLS